MDPLCSSNGANDTLAKASGDTTLAKSSGDTHFSEASGDDHGGIAVVQKRTILLVFR